MACSCSRDRALAVDSQNLDVRSVVGVIGEVFQFALDPQNVWRGIVALKAADPEFLRRRLSRKPHGIIKFLRRRPGGDDTFLKSYESRHRSADDKSQNYPGKSSGPIARLTLQGGHAGPPPAGIEIRISADRTERVIRPGPEIFVGSVWVVQTVFRFECVPPHPVLQRMSDINIRRFRGRLGFDRRVARRVFRRRRGLRPSVSALGAFYAAAIGSDLGRI